MPQIKPVRIHSSSPSHEKFPAANLLSKQKWKCQDQGEKMAFVVLELEEPSEINGIDIGNESSCFIEVRVANKGAASDSDFKELLLTSSFQTPTESRNSENPNRVRCFQRAALVESNATKKWDLVKIICTQPFNSRVLYGISFVTLYTPEETKKPSQAEPAREEPALAKKKSLFSLREDSPDSDSDNNSTSLFSRWKQARLSTEANASPSRVTAAAAIKDARSSIAERRSPMISTPTDKARQQTKPSTGTPVLDRNRSRLLYDDDDEEEGNEKLELLIEKDKKRAQEELEKDPKHKPAKKFKFSEMKENEDRPPSTSKSPPPVHEEKVPDKEKPKKPKTYKPFKKLLEGVVLTISGIQNPERGNLRAKALEMGAKYRTDWDDSCTHLICAFRNTPKYNQVQGIGKIVRKDWLLQCHSNRRHIPWRRFALDNKEADKSESEAEIFDEADKDSVQSEKPREAVEVIDEVGDDDILLVYDKVEEPVVICDSDSDTEDEIEKVRTEGTKKDDNSKEDNFKHDKRKEEDNSKDEKEDSVDVIKRTTTDEDQKKKNGTQSGPNFLTGKRFYLDEDNGAVKIIKCNSIITKLGGEVIESKDACDYWIKSGPAGADKLKSVAPIIRPLWLEECADMDCLLPIKRYCY